jgi:SpoVK/Ycf46/Vps4 family AAA+-type ATPase
LRFPSTNLEPKELVDEAFLRRIRYKIKIDHPTKEKFEDIFHMLCGTAGISFKKEVFDYLLDNYYGRFGVKFNACHPRDIIDQIVVDAHYYGHQPQMTKENIEAAWENYFVEE